MKKQKINEILPKQKGYTENSNIKVTTFSISSNYGYKIFY